MPIYMPHMKLLPSMLLPKLQYIDDDNDDDANNTNDDAHYDMAKDSTCGLY